MTTSNFVLLADRIEFPADTAAMLCDMDGVLLDTLQLDYEVVNAIAAGHLSGNARISADSIRRNFAFDPPEFWRRLLEEAGVTAEPAQLDHILDEYEVARRTASPSVIEGIVEILTAAKSLGLPIAVVSNNPTTDVVKILENAAIAAHFDLILGNDRPGLRKKPAPDFYLAAANLLDVSPDRCLVLEDSLIGCEAGHRAGCYTIAVATGANSIGELENSPFPDRCYANFSTRRTSK